jgi:hypothetical protein
MPSPATPQRTQPLLPAGQRWGTGVDSLTPYLRDAFAQRPRNPVFTPNAIVSLAWPAGARARNRK